MLFVKHFASIPPMYGGLTVYVKRLSLALCKHGYLSGAFYRSELSGVPEEFSYLFDKLPRHARSFYIIPELPKLYSVCKRYKIIHTHLSFKTIFCMWLIHKLQNKPLVITVHNEMIDREMTGLNILDIFCLKSLFKDARVQVITVNTRAKSLLEQRNYSFANEIKVIPAYISPVEVGEKSDYLSDELLMFIKQYRRYIVFYAESFAYNNDEEIYGTEDCIKAFIDVKKTCPDIGLVFCMPNVNDNRRLMHLKELVDSSGFIESIYWQLEPITEMWPLLKDSALYLRTTSTDGDSVLLREALCMGVPSLASDVVPRPHGCRVYKFADHYDLQEQIRYLLDGHETPMLSSEDYFQDMLDVYNNLLTK